MSKNTLDNKNFLPEPESGFAWAQKAAKEGDWSESAKRYAVLRQAYPLLPATWFGAINAHINADEDDKAAALLEEAEVRFPDNPNIFLHPARLALKHKNYDEAASLLEQARQKHPNNPAVWLQSADCTIKKGHFDQAEQFNAQAKKLAPDTPPPHKQYAELAMTQQNWTEALERWEQFRKQFPNDPAGYMQAAKSAEALGDLKLAKKLKLANEYGDEILIASEEAQTTIEPQNKKHRHATIIGLAELVWTKAVFNLRSETQRNYLSYLWWILEPLLHMVVYFLVFGFLLQRGGEGFITFLLTGLIPYMWFNKAMSASSNSIIGGQGLMLQVGIPSIVFPLVSLLQATLKQIPVYAVLLCFVWLQGHAPDIHWWGLFPVIMLQLLLTITLGTLLAALIPFIRDVSYLVPTGLTFLMFLSGIFYSYESIPPAWQDVFLMNPIAFLLKCYREVLVDGIWPDFYSLGMWTLIAGTGLVISLIAYKKLRYIFPRVVLA